MKTLNYKLYKKSSPSEIAENKNIFDVLTGSERSLLYFNSNENNEINQIMFGINYTDKEGNPVKLEEDIYARGFTLIGKNSDILFLINSEKKVITLGKNDFDIFSNSDKVSLKNQYIAVPDPKRSLIDEIRDEFYKRDYFIISRYRSPSRLLNP